MGIYCVYLTIYRGNKLPPFYIGSTSVKNIESGYRYGVEHHNKSTKKRNRISNKRKSDATREIYLEVKQLYKILQRKIPNGTYMLSENKSIQIKEILSNEIQS